MAKAKTKTVSKKQATGNRPGPKARVVVDDMHEIYAEPWSALLEALNDVDVPKAEYKESLDTMLSELQTRHDAVVAELAEGKI